MKTKIIEMYRLSQYKSWYKAQSMGGIYRVEVPEDTLDNTIRALINVTNICMNADDPVTWRVKPTELTALQKAFIKAYHENAGEATPEQVEQYLRGSVKGMTTTEMFRLHDHYRMFVAGTEYDTRR